MGFVFNSVMHTHQEGRAAIDIIFLSLNVLALFGKKIKGSDKKESFHFGSLP
jgi:hypothetical protein